ncbi:MAG: P-II family nitrogen regulator [Candidatus Scalindua sp.]|nr:P-II family nitrogen regulator [Candidatus Scalindua sp.]
MKKVEAFIRPEKLNMTKDALEEQGLDCISVTEIKGHGHQKGVSEIFRGKKYMVELLPKLKIEIIVADHDVDKVVQTITRVSQTGSIGDGKIFVYDVMNAYRIRTGEQGEVAI